MEKDWACWCLSPSVISKYLIVSRNVGLHLIQFHLRPIRRSRCASSFSRASVDNVICIPELRRRKDIWVSWMTWYNCFWERNCQFCFILMGSPAKSGRLIQGSVLAVLHLLTSCLLQKTHVCLFSFFSFVTEYFVFELYQLQSHMYNALISHYKQLNSALINEFCRGCPNVATPDLVHSMYPIMQCEM